MSSLQHPGLNPIIAAVAWLNGFESRERSADAEKMTSVKVLELPNSWQCCWVTCSFIYVSGKYWRII